MMRRVDNQKRIQLVPMLLLLGLVAGCGTSTGPEEAAELDPFRPGGPICELIGEGNSQGAIDPDVEPFCDNHEPLRQPFFGDLHVHTVLSLDANTQQTRNGPRIAYQYAKGEEVGIQPYTDNDEPTRFVQIARPLDFAAATDHVELFGEVELCTNPEHPEFNFPECQFYRQDPQNAFIFFNFAALGAPEQPNFPIPEGVPVVQDQPAVGDDGKIPRLPYCGPDGQRCREEAKGVWLDIQAAADEHYDRTPACNFTTFNAYEYTGAPQSNNLHRNVIFRGDVVPEEPPAYQENPDPQILWETLDEFCGQVDGCDVLTIPHNSNLSGGLMFRNQDKNGNPYDAAYAAQRQFNEPLAEIYQHKGQSECLGTQGAGAQDELCGFELLPYNNLTGERFGGANTGPPLEGDFLREAMKEGLVFEEDLGVNPFKYGFIASTDTHIATPGLALENAYPGHGGAGQAASEDSPPGLADFIENSPGGLAVVWAEENTRDSIYAALRRREVYSTSGLRPIVRFFAGWEIPENLCDRTNFVELGYQLGVPMGGDLVNPPTPDSKPVFAVSALRDPGHPSEPSEPLQRIQIIKLWLDINGEKQEQVLDVAGDANNGATVDVATCETSGPGFNSLCAVYVDNDFNPDERAIYYARVVDNPSCRWATQQCVANNIDCDDPDNVPAEFENCCNADYPKAIQERAWTSPVFYAPGEFACAVD